MPSKSKAQQSLMGAALAVKRGETKLSDLSPSLRRKVREILTSMSTRQVRDFAKTKRKGLPRKKAKKA